MSSSLLVHDPPLTLPFLAKHMGGLRTNLIMIAVALAVLAALLFARRELTRALSESQPAAQTTP